MEPKFDNKRLAQKNKIELTAALVVLIEKIDYERKRSYKILQKLEPKSSGAHFIIGKINSYDNIMEIINVLL